jgi:hypothetical protein
MVLGLDRIGIESRGLFGLDRSGLPGVIETSKADSSATLRNGNAKKLNCRFGRDDVVMSFGAGIRLFW